jgi:ABC-type branched-subunit amino acid transport system ATPase component
LAHPVLHVEGLRAGYRGLEVLHGVDLTVRSGELVLLAGPNGAGKSTLLRTVIGLVKPTAGSVRLDGTDITGLPAHRRARLRCAWIPEGRGVIRELSVEENLDMSRFTPGWTAERREASYERFPILARTRDRAAGTLSGGEQQMLSLARALETAPRLLLVDEPSLGLAPRIVDEVMGVMLALREEGHSILLVEQRAAQVQHVASRIVLMREGHVSDAPDTIDFADLNLAEFAVHTDGSNP